MACTHHTEGENKFWYETCDWTGEEVLRHEYIEGVPTFVDTGLHSYKCTQCGEVFYYSQRGKEAVEQGKDIWD